MKKLGLFVFSLGIVGFASCSKENSTSPSIESSGEQLTASTVADRYIVVFKKGAVKVGVAGQAVEDVAASIQRDYGGSVVHTYKHALHGLAIRLTTTAVAAMRKDNRVAYIEPDGIVSINDNETGATWGIDRIDQRQLPLDQTYVYPTQEIGRASCRERV
jgi:Peptidase inhibitor I9.